MIFPRVSYTALSRFEKCSTAQRLYVERKRKDAKKEHVMVGNALHYGMQATIDTGGMLGAQQAALWEMERRVREERPQWDPDQLAEQIDRVRQGGLRIEELLESFRFKECRTEVKLLRVFKGWAIEAHFDLVAGQYEEIWDLKSGQWHHDQLVFYDVATQLVLDLTPARVGIIEPLGRGLISFQVTDEHRQDMRRRIQTFVQRVAAGDWQFEGYSAACGWCSSKPWCPKWDQARSGSFAVTAAGSMA